MANCVVFDVPITIHQGCTFDKPYSWKIGENDKTAETVSLVGYTGEMFLKEKLKDDANILHLELRTGPFDEDGPSGIYIDETINEWRIYINDADAALLCPNKKDVAGFYTLLLKNSYGEVVVKQWGPANMVLSY